jgi:hypothetical protein
MQTLEEQIAAAQIAQIFGSALKQVDENTVQQSSTGPATRIDPRSFLTIAQNQVQQQNNNVQERINKEAEMLYPLPPPVAVPPLPPPAPVVEPAPAVAVSSELIDVLKSFHGLFERFVTAYEKSVQQD